MQDIFNVIGWCGGGGKFDRVGCLKCGYTNSYHIGLN